MSEPDTAAILSMAGVRKSYDGRTAVDGVDITIPPKTIYGLLGPNGAGKTTILRMITGLLRPDEGSVHLFGQNLPGTKVAQAGIGYMPQSLAIYQNLSVEENLRFYGRIYGLEGEALEQRIDETLTVIDLADRRASVVADLSGGMVRRALLGTALVHKPKFLLLDEPTAGIDPLLRIKIWDTLEELSADGASIFVTTHHISEADRCHRVIFLRGGRVINEGSPADLKKSYNVDDLEAAFVAATGEEGRGQS